jgi:hypothetical protein|tara:strand:- start:939 stop:2567 length:1629 start_codon:yes stop_codon:yes gene_type:complete
MGLARERYEALRGVRSQFLDVARVASRLTLPYLIKYDSDYTETHKRLITPWQSVGAKCVTALSAKLMLSVLPPQTTFFKLQVRDDKLGEEMDPTIRSELDLSFSKIERMIMDYVNAQNDRVVIHAAFKHLIVGGNALLYMGKDGMKNYPLNRFVINRDGDGNVIEIVTKELIARRVLAPDLPDDFFKDKINPVSGDTAGVLNNTNDEGVEVYTYVRMNKQRTQWIWHQEVFDMILPGSRSTAPKDASPWIPLRYNVVDGEDYGRGRVEEFLGDFQALESLTQAITEGSAAAAKVVFLVSPSSTTKPQTIANAGNGAIVQGRPDDVAVIQVGKTADFKTAYEMIGGLTQRLQEAFMILNVRQSERTTAEEVRMTQMELEQQLGGLFSLMTTEFLVPYLKRTMLVLQRSNALPKIPKDLVRPQVVAGINAIGRGQDFQSLSMFLQTIAQTMGPEAIQQYVDGNEYIMRLAAAQGIDVLNLIKTKQQLEQEKQQNMEMQTKLELTKQEGQFASAPMNDPSKNPALNEQLENESANETPAQEAGGT